MANEFKLSFTAAQINTKLGEIDNLAKKAELPTNISDLMDDSAHRVVTDAEKAIWNAKSDFSGNYNDLTNKPDIPSIDGLATETYVDNKISAIPTPDVSGQINAHNTATGAHSDIRDLISQLSSEKVGVTAQTLTDEQKAQARANIGAAAVGEAGGGGGAAQPDWADITNKPVITEGGDTLTWDGNTEGLVNLDSTLYKVSDVVPTLDDLVNGCTATANGIQYPCSAIQDGDLIYISAEDGSPVAMLVPFDNAYAGSGSEETKVAEKGTYLFCYAVDPEFSVFVSSLTINGYTGFGKEKIDPSYLYQPDWNQTDETAADFIKNKPFHDEVNPKLFDGNVELSDSGDYMFDPYFELISGTVYSVKYGGTVYTLPASTLNLDGMDYVIWGNEMMLGGTANGEVPIAVVCMPTYQITMMQDMIGAVSTAIQLIIVEGGSIGDTVTADDSIDTMYSDDNGVVHRVSKNVVTKDDLTGGYQITFIADGSERTVDETECSLRELPGFTQIVGPTGDYLVYLSTGEVFPQGVGLADNDDVTVKSFTIKNSTVFLKVVELRRMEEKFLPESVESIVIRSSTADSTKMFKITVDDSGVLTATEV